MSDATKSNDLDMAKGLPDEDLDLTDRFIRAVEISNEIKRIKGFPIAKIDPQNKRPYLEYPDGTREYAK